MTRLVVSAFIGQGTLRLLLNGLTILENNDNVTIYLDDQSYVLQWFVDASPLSSFSITVSSPKEAEFQLTKVVGSGGKDFGGIRF